MARAVTEIWMWEELGEAMDQDFKSAPKKFWLTFWFLRRGKWDPVHTAYSVGWELLTSTESIRWWEEYFEDLVNPTNTHSEEEGESEDFGLGPPSSGAGFAGDFK